MELSSSFVLHTQPFRNTSLLAELFSKEYGRVKVVARSARGPKTRFRSYLQPFNPLLSAWMGKGELKTLTHLELAGSPFPLTANALWCGFYLNELLVGLLPREDAHPDIFECYQTTLHHLCASKLDEWHLRLFEKQLLQSLGYGVSLTTEVETGETIQADFFYQLILQRGFVRASTHDTSLSIFSGKSLLAFANDTAEDAMVLSEAKRLMRILLAHYLGKPIKSREFI